MEVLPVVKSDQGSPSREERESGLTGQEVARLHLGRAPAIPLALLTGTARLWTGRVAGTLEIIRPSLDYQLRLVEKERAGNGGEQSLHEAVQRATSVRVGSVTLTLHSQRRLGDSVEIVMEPESEDGPNNARQRFPSLRILMLTDDDENQRIEFSGSTVQRIRGQAVLPDPKSDALAEGDALLRLGPATAKEQNIFAPAWIVPVYLRGDRNVQRKMRAVMNVGEPSLGPDVSEDLRAFAQRLRGGGRDPVVREAESSLDFWHGHVISILQLGPLADADPQTDGGVEGFTIHTQPQPLAFRGEKEPVLARITDVVPGPLVGEITVTLECSAGVVQPAFGLISTILIAPDSTSMPKPAWVSRRISWSFRDRRLVAVLKPDKNPRQLQRGESLTREQIEFSVSRTSLVCREVLRESGAGALYEALVIAHELSHGMGAVHVRSPAQALLLLGPWPDDLSTVRLTEQSIGEMRARRSPGVRDEVHVGGD